MKYPRIAIVSRRSVRKDKYIDYVGEFHLELVAKFNAIPIIVPRIEEVLPLLDSIFPIHGLLLTEGEDIGSIVNSSKVNESLSESDSPAMDGVIDAALLKQKHPSDENPDESKDTIETYLIRRCLKEKIPILAICRGSQLLNVLNGGELYSDIELQHHSEIKICHMNYDNYDKYRHPINILSGTPLYSWFGKERNIKVNSYHHQGIYKLGERFAPMAFAPDGIIEGYYDPNYYNPKQGKFLVGLQFHPERMQDINMALNHHQSIFEDHGHIKPYEEFITAAFAFLNIKSLSIRKVVKQRKLIRRNHYINPHKNMSDYEVMKTIDAAGASVHGVHIMRNILYELSDKENDHINTLELWDKKHSLASLQETAGL